MNRKKKIKSTLLAKQKKANAKLHKVNKPKYVSKAERARLAELEQQQGADGCSDADQSTSEK
ncbi:DUF2986 domain-containing protein [Thalassotalea sp. HSM 43]|uniref:DUF2986 domain-containing protein n=1 Tax=Thalassotalea sp. HSM 43 TaxID=2552945 RepID=UPI0010816658|nr:DUF2986 domain-containing protein [Thalassotalea sp. HSM 43]QBY05630.1 DUF2986 domain-containing protein [Thalassotalea sp. HSM 43]